MCPVRCVYLCLRPLTAVLSSCASRCKHALIMRVLISCVVEAFCFDHS